MQVAAEATTRNATPGPAPRDEHGAQLPPPLPAGSALLQADRVARSLRGALERTAVPLARAAAAFIATKSWCDFGFARLDDYARERLGRSGRWVRDFGLLGQRLPFLDGLPAAMTGDDGRRPIGRVAATLVAKVASPTSIDRWIAVARTSSIRDLRDAVRAARQAEAEANDARAEHVATGSSTPGADATDAGTIDDDPAARILVRLPVPSSVLAAFDEALDLFHAVEGGEAPVTAFVEALIAETSARTGGDLGFGDEAGSVAALRDAALRDADPRALGAGPSLAAVERDLAASTGNWRHLPEHSESSWALSLAGVTLARFRALADEAGRGDAVDLDRQLRALVDLENEMETRLGGLLADLHDLRAWPRLRFTGVGHYGEERLGLSRTTAEDRARLARDLRPYPLLRDAYASGRIGRETAALVARLLRAAPPDPAREAAWVERASESTVKRMRDEARATGRYRLLGPRVDARIAAAGPEPLSDSDWHASIRREPGLARRRLREFGALTLCSPDVFHRSPEVFHRSADVFPSGPDVFQATPLAADAFLRLRLPDDLGRQFLAAVDSECRRLSASAETLPWDADPDASPDADPDADTLCSAPSRLLARMYYIRARRLPVWVGLLALLEDFVETWDDPAATPRRASDAIYIRDGYRCMAPGCTSRRNLEDHHVVYRSRRGDDSGQNRVSICAFHHRRGEHGGLASCRGRAPIDLTWRLGRDGDAAAWYRNERRIEAPPR